MAMGACGEEDLSLSLSLSSSWPSLGPVNRSVWFIYRYLLWFFIHPYPPLPLSLSPSLPPVAGGDGGRREGCMHVDIMDGGQDRLDRLTDVATHACRRMCLIQCVSV